MFNPQYLLALSFFGTLVSAFLSLLWSARASSRIALSSLAFFSFLGIVAAGYVVFGGQTVLSLPSFFPPLAFFFSTTSGLDRLGAIFFLLLNLCAFFSALFGMTYMPRHAYLHHARSVGFFFAVTLFALDGALLSTSLIGFLFFSELAVLSSFALVVRDGGAVPRSHAYQYFVTHQFSASALAAGFFLLANGAVLGSFGSLALMEHELSPLRLFAACGLLFLGFAARAGLVPFHGWLLSVDKDAPTYVLPLLSLGSTLSAFYGVLRSMVFLLENPPLAIGAAFIILGLFTAVFGALLLSIEEGMKEALSYDTVKNTGLVFAFFGAALIGARFSLPTLANASLFAAFLVFVSHTFVKSGLLLGSGVIALQTRTDSLEGMGGLARRMPRFSVVFGVLALCAAALPPSGAFLGASGFAEGALSDIHAVPSQFGILLGIAFALFFLVNGLTFFGMVKVFAMAFLGRPSSLGAENAVEPDLGYFAPIACLALLAVAAGLFAPELFSRIGANTHFATDAFSGPRSTIVFLGIVVVVVILRMFFTSPKKVRMQSPWNGGEALTPRMEYTATAFGSPLRFFFRFLLTFHRRRVMVSTPLLSTNPWFTVKAFRRETDPSWKKIIAPYLLGAKGLFLRMLAGLQSGNVQTYVAMMLLTLSACILLAL